MTEPKAPQKLSPELSTSLANAVSYYFTQKYPADNVMPVSQSGKSVLLLMGRSGRDIKKNIPRATFQKAMQRFRMMEPHGYATLKDAPTMPLKKFYGAKFYLALTLFWDYLEVLLDEEAG